MLYGKVDPVVVFQDSTFQQWAETNGGPAISAAYQGSNAPAERLFQEAFPSTAVCNAAATSPATGDLCPPIGATGPPIDTFFLKIWEASEEPAHTWSISAAARSSDDVRPWIDQNICPNSGYSSGPFYVEALWTFGILDRPYVLPMDPGYREMISCSPYS